MTFIVSWILIASGTLLVLANLAFVMLWLVKKKSGSLFPVIGGVLMGIGLWMAPHQELRAVWWVPLLLDPGCALMVGGGILLNAIDYYRAPKENKRHSD